MTSNWISQLQQQEDVVQHAREIVEQVVISEKINEDQARKILAIVREGNNSFQIFSRKIREEDLDSFIYRSASVIEDKWDAIIEEFVSKIKFKHRRNITE